MLRREIIMNRSGFYKSHSDGIQVFIPTGTNNIHSVANTLKAAEQQKTEAEKQLKFFIPSFKFFGPEMPLKAAMRKLMTEKLNA